MALTGLTPIQITNLNVSGIATFEQAVGVGGTLTYQDVTNVDAVGIITARVGVNVPAGQLDIGSNIKIGNSGIATASNFKTGSSNLHSAGVEVAGVNVLGADTPIGVGATIYNSGGAIFAGTSGVVTATAFHGSGANLTGITQTTINSNADNRIITGSGTANTLNAETNAVIDSTGRLLVGTGHGTSRNVGDLTAKIQLEGAGYNQSSLSLMSNAGASAGNTPHLTLGKSRGSSNGSNTIIANNDALGQIQFAGADGTDCNSVAASIIGRVDGTPGSNDMPGRLVFSTTADGAAAPSERMKIDSAGNVTITDGNLVIGTAGHGIDFSATGQGGSSSSMSNELLSDYEEGTWVPVAHNFTIAGTYHANYTRIGRMVHITMWIQTNTGSSGAPFYIAGLPYTVKTGNVYQYACGRLGSNSFTNSQNDIVFEFTTGNTTIFPKVQDGGMNWGMASGTHVMLTGSYIV